VIEWANFRVVVIAALVGGCGVVTLFALGLRFAGPETDGRLRGLGVVFFVICGLLVALGVCLVIPALGPFFATI
jgi:hypothetical protein